MRNVRQLQLLSEFTFYALLFFIFFQLLTSFIEATYVFGLLGTSIPPEIGFVLLLLAPLLLVLFPTLIEHRAGLTGSGGVDRTRSTNFARLVGLLAALCWSVSFFQDTRGKMLADGLGVGLMLLCLIALLHVESGQVSGYAIGGGLAFSGLISILVYSGHFGNNLIESGEYFVLGWALALMFVFGLFRWAGPREVALPVPTPGIAAPHRKAGFGRTTLICLGLYSTLLLLYFGFLNPAVIARWTGGNYPLITALAAGSLALTTGAWFRMPRWRKPLTGSVLLAWNAAFIIALAVTLRANSINFPCCVEDYPFYAPDAGVIGAIAMLAMLVLHPVIYIDFGWLSGIIVDDRPEPRVLAGGMTLGALYLVVMIFAQVFTTVYDYIPVIGPLFRDRFWIVVTIPALVLLAAVSSHRQDRLRAFTVPGTSDPLIYGLGLLALALLFAAAFESQPVRSPAKQDLRVLTYNIQQGYGREGQKSINAQIELVRGAKPDLVGLEETDAARIAGGNSDLVRLFAGRLKMYAYYGPKTTTGTFGIALLSRYPILNPRTFFMYSQGEQTAAIEAQINVGGRLFTVLVTHLGNGGPLVQQQEVLGQLQGKANVIAMGDFNFRPDSEQYRLTTTQYADAWEIADSKRSAPEEDVATRIDHIFLSRGLTVSTAEYLPRGPSDHPAMFAAFGW